MMKLNTTLLLTLCACSQAIAGPHPEEFFDTATVISSTPIIERVREPQKECWTERVRVEAAPAETEASSDSGNGAAIGGAIVGGLVGGVLGHQVGKGKGNTAATIAGAVAGSMIGSKVASSTLGGDKTESAPPPSNNKPQYREEERCEEVDGYREITTGYNVSYNYRGQKMNTQLPYKPGKTLKIALRVVADEEQAKQYQREQRDRERELDKKPRYEEDKKRQSERYRYEEDEPNYRYR